jgi:hypothetical protein
VFALMLLAGLLSACYGVGKRGLAEVIAQEPRYQIANWRSGEKIPNDGQLNVIQAELHKALDLDPANPTLLEDLGGLYASRLQKVRPSDSRALPIRGQTLDFIRQAVRQRPTSGQAWINLALMKLRLGEIDSEFSLSLQQALHRTPWQPQVQLLGIELGLASWQALTEPLQQEIASAVRAQAGWLLVNQKPPLIQMLKRYRRSDLACPWAGAAFPCPAA